MKTTLRCDNCCSEKNDDIMTGTAEKILKIDIEMKEFSNDLNTRLFNIYISLVMELYI